jgi:hypothetical protein
LQKDSFASVENENGGISPDRVPLLQRLIGSLQLAGLRFGAGEIDLDLDKVRRGELPELARLKNVFFQAHARRTPIRPGEVEKHRFVLALGLLQRGGEVGQPLRCDRLGEAKQSSNANQSCFHGVI